MWFMNFLSYTIVRNRLTIIMKLKMNLYQIWMKISYHFLDHKSRRASFLNNSVLRNVRILKSRLQNFSFLSSKIFNTNACTSGFGLIRTSLQQKRSECTAYNEARYKRSRELSNAIKCGSVWTSSKFSLSNSRRGEFNRVFWDRRWCESFHLRGGGGCEKVLWIGGHASPREKGW